MKKLLIIPFLFIFLFSCESQLDKAIPKTSLMGAVSNFSIIYPATQEDTSGNIIKVSCLVPPDINREKIKPTILATLKQTLKDFPKGKKVFINVAPDEDMIELTYLAAQGIYENNKIIINYLIPSDKEMEEHNSQIGKLFPSTKNCRGIFNCDEDYTKMVKNNDPLMFRPDQKTYMKYKPIFKVYEDFKYYKSKEKYKNGEYLSSSTDYYMDVSKKTGYPIKDIKEAVNFMSSYYSWSWKGEESINIPL